jgi:hypothetical protein
MKPQRKVRSGTDQGLKMTGVRNWSGREGERVDKSTIPVWPYNGPPLILEASLTMVRCFFFFSLTRKQSIHFIHQQVYTIR